MNGWIKIHRKLLEWEWYTETNTLAVFIHLLLIVNYEPTRWRGIDIKTGETIKSLGTLAEEANISVRSIRTAIKNLKSTGEVTERRHGKHRILMLTKFEEYQQDDTESDTIATRKRQGSDREVTTDKEYKNIRIKEYPYSPHGGQND